MGIGESHIRKRKKRLSKNHTKEEPRVTGIVGAGRAMGVTHLAILTANYYCSGCGRKTAVLERNDHGDFARFGKICTGKSGKEQVYRIQGADFYPESGETLLADCLHADYEEIIIDFGTLDEQKTTGFLCCHRVCLVVSFSEWQEGPFGENEHWRESAEANGWLCLAAFGSEESRIQWNKRRRPMVFGIPFSADAFTLAGVQMEWMRQMM